ncbi:50S ribosomal protein L11 methyltransferase [Streptomyces sp. Rer75]|uniref:50S ribosomal protein L11 methyltransferase n=1 Tax=Streptomyces sp. Rer75 TaxID=2750011 RepID=UPI00211EC065|nr:50S ribosomal protein L11 methyltransferase [Streptomyces sp. Rer75]
MAGREWDLLDGVFAPPFSATTEVALKILGLVGDGEERFRRQGSFLEVGSGTGVIAVSAALAGCRRVVATDISSSAVENTRMNAERHMVADRVRALESDVFSALDPGERFDTVYWHSNFVLAPPEYRYMTEHEAAYVDPGYRAHRRYLAEAPLLLAEGGRALLQFSDRGDLDRLYELAADCGRELTVLCRYSFLERTEILEHILLEITVAA